MIVLIKEMRTTGGNKETPKLSFLSMKLNLIF